MADDEVVGAFEETDGCITLIMKSGNLNRMKATVKSGSIKMRSKERD